MRLMGADSGLIMVTTRSAATLFPNPMLIGFIVFVSERKEQSLLVKQDLAHVCSFHDTLKSPLAQWIGSCLSRSEDSGPKKNRLGSSKNEDGCAVWWIAIEG